ncbi:hypothetical protein ACFFMP_17655 [Pseudoroseomonas cervicalis]|uniref:hypothetical protein n=1 Tax=Teichococcus cervicalis TaxID=204525 RepID=UPI0035EA3399
MLGRLLDIGVVADGHVQLAVAGWIWWLDLRAMLRRSGRPGHERTCPRPGWSWTPPGWNRIWPGWC